MTKGEKQLAAAISVSVGLFAAAFGAALLFSGSIYLIDQALRLAHLRNGSRYDRIGFIGYTAVITIVLGLFMLGSAALDIIKRNGWRSVFMPAFLWPIDSSPTPTVAARIGRVLHWTFVACAAGALAIGVFASLSESDLIGKRRLEQQQWDQTHAIPGRPGYAYESIEGDYGIREYRPVIPDDEWQGTAFGLAAAFALALAGRAFRYVLAAE